MMVLFYMSADLDIIANLLQQMIYYSLLGTAIVEDWREPIHIEHGIFEYLDSLVQEGSQLPVGKGRSLGGQE